MKYIILAGGSGTRLWPLSRRHFAKQFLRLINDKTLIQNTAIRVSKQNGKDIFVISNEASKFIIIQQLQEVLPEFTEKNLIIEPVARNTAPAIALGTTHFDEEEILVILSSDHYIDDETRFNKILLEAGKIAKNDYIVTLGIIPNSPKTGYGYIKKSNIKVSKGFKVDKFVEKPTHEKACEYLKDGNYFWNAGIFIFKIKTFLKEIQKYADDIYKTLEKIKTKTAITREDFMKFPKISIDYAVMEKSDKLVVLPSDFGWNDIGSFKSLYEVSNKNEDGNVLKINNNNFININSKNLLVYGNKKIATINIEDICIIDTPDALLVANKNNAEQVKDVAEKLEKENAMEIKTPIFEYFQWGMLTIINKGQNYIIKKLYINPGSNVFIKSYNNGSSTVTVIEGDASITQDKKKINIKTNESSCIQLFSDYNIKNPSKDKELILIIIQSGEI